MVFFAGALPGLLGPGLLLGHALVETVLVHAHAALLGHVVDNVQREPKSIVEFEGHIAGDAVFTFLFQGGDLLFQNDQALVQGLGEPTPPPR